MADDLMLQFVRYGENSDGHCGCDSCPEDSTHLMGLLKENTALKQRSSGNIKAHSHYLSTYLLMIRTTCPQATAKTTISRVTTPSTPQNYFNVHLNYIDTCPRDFFKIQRR